MEVEIPEAVLSYAERTFRYLVPDQRQSGFQEHSSGQTRGDGDLCDLIGSLMLFDLLCQKKIVCSMNITSGMGDDNDIRISIRKSLQNWNIKTSRYAPFREGLNLFVKQEELEKPMDGWFQIFVHTNEDGRKPHIHMAGFVTRKTKAWEKYGSRMIEIPRTGGHMGVGIPISELLPLDTLFSAADKKF